MSRNQTFFKEFILLGYPQKMQVCILFFALSLLMYSFAIFGNTLLIITVILSPKLHLPMYFFLCNLSFLDLCYSSISLPTMLTELFAEKRTIPLNSCLVQMYTGTFLGCTESLLLAIMAYDRYVAICFPLYYHAVMNVKICLYIAIVMWSGSFLMAVVPYVSRPLGFCSENKLDHFVCEMLAVVQIACINAAFYGVVLFVFSIFVLIMPMVFIVISYIRIIFSIVKIKSTDGRSKAFSTCASHLIVVCFYYGTCITMYTGQSKSFFPNLKYISLIYGVVTPVLNPLIYSLRNNDVKESFKKVLKCA